jgi:hypothetical protein
MIALMNLNYLTIMLPNRVTGLVDFLGENEVAQSDVKVLGHFLLEQFYTFTKTSDFNGFVKIVCTFESNFDVFWRVFLMGAFFLQILSPT